MFEDSTFESQGRIHTRSSNWMLATLLFNGSILLTLILIPLLHPGSLPNELRKVLITAPAAPHAPAAQSTPHTSPQSPTAPRLIEVPLNNTIRQIHIDTARPDTSGPPSDTNPCIGCSPLGTSNGAIPGGDPFAHSAPSPAPHLARPQGPVTISKGVAEGMLISPIVPAYPAIARAARVEGTVILQATISKTGTIENLRVLSGPPMLQRAAIDTVKQWRYRPYLLNGDPVEVETTIHVVFSLGR
jgi:protein TonB